MVVSASANAPAFCFLISAFPTIPLPGRSRTSHRPHAFARARHHAQNSSFSFAPLPLPRQPEAQHHRSAELQFRAGGASDFSSGLPIALHHRRSVSRTGADVDQPSHAPVWQAFHAPISNGTISSNGTVKMNSKNYATIQDSWCYNNSSMKA